MLRGTVYIIGADGVPRSRSVERRTAQDDLSRFATSLFRASVEEVMRIGGELRDGERLEFGPIAEEWSGVR